MNDQAERLREIALNVKQQIETEIRQELKVTRVIAVSSAKGEWVKALWHLMFLLTFVYADNGFY